MKKVIAALLIASAILGYAQSIPKDGKIYLSGWGNRVSGTINDMLTRLGANNAVIVLDAGEWSITNNVTVPANVRLEVPYGSTIDIDSGVVFTVNGPFDADVHTVFDGLGTAAGSALFPYRYTQWGDTNQYNIGNGQIQADVNSISAILATSADANGESITNLTTVEAVTGDFEVVIGDLTSTGDNTWSGSNTFNGQFLAPSNSALAGYQGYPRLTTLTTNMLTSGSSAGTLVTLDSWTNAFDGNVTTVTSEGSADVANHTYWVDLGDIYSGHIYITASASNATTVGYMVMSLISALDTNAITSGSPIIYAGTDGNGNGIVWDNTGGRYVTNSWSIPFVGRYVGAHFYETGAGQTTVYKINEFSVYGITNEFSGMGGW